MLQSFERQAALKQSGGVIDDALAERRTSFLSCEITARLIQRFSNSAHYVNRLPEDHAVLLNIDFFRCAPCCTPEGSSDLLCGSDMLALTTAHASTLEMAMWN